MSQEINQSEKNKAIHDQIIYGTGIIEYGKHVSIRSDRAKLLIEELAKSLYEKDGFNYGCLPTEEAWKKDRENVRKCYLEKAKEQIK